MCLIALRSRTGAAALVSELVCVNVDALDCTNVFRRDVDESISTYSYSDIVE